MKKCTAWLGRLAPGVLWSLLAAAIVFTLVMLHMLRANSGPRAHALRGSSPTSCVDLGLTPGVLPSPDRACRATARSDR